MKIVHKDPITKKLHQIRGTFGIILCPSFSTARRSFANSIPKAMRKHGKVTVYKPE